MQYSFSPPKKYHNLLSLNVIASISLALFIFGLCGLLILQANQLGSFVRNNFEIQVFLNHKLKKAQINKIRLTLSDKPYTRYKNTKAEVVYVSKQKAKEEFIKNTGEDFSQFLEDNPLRNSYIIKVKPEYYAQNRLQKIKADLEGIPGVFEANYVQDLVNTINKNIAMISLILLVFGIFILLTVIILIDNTIKLALFSQRFLIRSMQLVGATDSFIQRPFVIQSFIQGFIGGLVSSIVLFACIKYLHFMIPDLLMIFNVVEFILLLIVLLLMGSLIGGLSAYRAVKKYLRVSLDALY